VVDSYAALFSVRAVEPLAASDPLPYVEELVRTWASHDGITPPEANGRSVSGSGDEYEITAERCSEGEYWWLRWTRPDADGRAFAWVSDVRLAHAATEAVVEVSLEVRVVETGSAPPERVSIGAPRLVSVLASDKKLRAEVDGRQLSGSQFIPTNEAHAPQELVERTISILCIAAILNLVAGGQVHRCKTRRA